MTLGDETADVITMKGSLVGEDGFTFTGDDAKKNTATDTDHTHSAAAAHALSVVT